MEAYSYYINRDSWNIATPVAKSRRTRTAQKPIQSVKEAFEAKYPKWAFIVTLFAIANKLKCVQWKDMSRIRIQRFVDYLNQRYSPNTVNQYCSRLKAILNMFSDDVKLPKGYAKILSPRKVASTAVFLTEEELCRIENYKPKNAKEEYVRNIFLISAYTGARQSDAMKFTSGNISGDWLCYVSQKTKQKSRVPLKPIVTEYIKNTASTEITECGFIKIIQRICKLSGINERVKIFKAGTDIEDEKWRFIGSHTARRSFASNLYLRGLDIHSISRFLGHTDSKMTQRYIVPTSRELTENEAQFFA